MGPVDGGKSECKSIMDDEIEKQREEDNGVKNGFAGFEGMAQM